MKIRPMFAADLDAVLANEFTGYDFPWTRGVFTDCLKVGNQCWVLEQAGEVLGHAIVTIGAGEAHLLNTLEVELTGAASSPDGRTVALYSRDRLDVFDVGPWLAE